MPGGASLALGTPRSVPSESTGTSQEVPDVEGLLDDLNSAVEKASEGRDREQLESLLGLFRQAEFARLRGDDPSARRLFESLRVRLLHREEVLRDSRSDAEEQLRVYVLAQLSRG